MVCPSATEIEHRGESCICRRKKLFFNNCISTPDLHGTLIPTSSRMGPLPSMWHCVYLISTLPPLNPHLFCMNYRKGVVFLTLSCSLLPDLQILVLIFSRRVYFFSFICQVDLLCQHMYLFCDFYLFIYFAG